MSTVILHYDGLCEPRNPGGVATSGWHIAIQNGEVLTQGSQVIRTGPTATNNWGEYCALGLGLRWLADHRDTLRLRHVAAVLALGDSLLSVRQIRDEWRCNAPHLIRLRARCWELIDVLEDSGIRFRIAWIPRDENEIADRLSQQAYEQYTGRKVIPRSKKKLSSPADTWLGN